MTALSKHCMLYLKNSPGRSCYMQMKAKKKWIKRTKTMEQQADEDGWVYVYGPKIIRGWNSIWVEQAREGQGEAEEKALRPCIPAPIECVLRG